MGQNDNVEPKSAEDFLAGMSEDSRILLERAQVWADCKVRTADGFEFELHKLTLTQESVVLGNMIMDLGQDVTALTVSEDATSMAKLVDAMYAPEAPLTTDNIDELSELQRKFDMKRLHGSCSRFISSIPLSIDNFSRWHILASKFGYTAALKHCRDFIGTERFDEINRTHPDWLKGLSPEEALEVVKDRLDRLVTMCISHDSQ